MIFEVENGSFYYSPGKTILKDVSFSAGDGDVLAVLGPNGAGKTTLLKCMTGLLPWKKGRSRLDGADIRHIPPQRLWRSLAYVPQARAMQFSYTARDMVLMGRSAHIGAISQPSRKDAKIAGQAMDTIGISFLADKPCCCMSGGELQMVLIARALAAEPRVLVLDEPESNLDYKNQLIVLDTVRRLALEKGLCAIFNTHYPAHALRISGKAILLDGRGNCRFGASSEIINRENMRSSFSVDVHIGKIDIDSDSYDLVVPLRVV